MMIPPQLAVNVPPIHHSMVWSEKIKRQFQTVPLNPSDQDFYGPYNKLLHTLYPPDTDFTVIPQYLEVNSRSLVDRVSAFEVYLENRLVLILELKKPDDMNFISRREAADLQVR